MISTAIACDRGWELICGLRAPRFRPRFEADSGTLTYKTTSQLSSPTQPFHEMDPRKPRPLGMRSVDIAVCKSNTFYNPPKLTETLARGYITKKGGLYKCTVCNTNSRASRGEWKTRHAIRQHEKRVIHRRLVELSEEKVCGGFCEIMRDELISRCID